MLSFLSLASLIALSQAGVLPAGINAATCTNYPFLSSQVWKLMLLLRMPSLLGWELPLGPSGTKHTWLLRPDSSSSSNSLLTSTTLIIRMKIEFSGASFDKEGAVNKSLTQVFLLKHSLVTKDTQ